MTATIQPPPQWPPAGDPFYSRALEVYNALRQYLPVPAAIGILANADMESALRPDVVGDHGTAYNIFQWHWDPRGQRILNEYKADVRKETSLPAVVNILMWELTTYYPHLLSQIRAAKTAEEAAGLFCDDFEGAGAKNARERRQADAARWTVWIAKNAR